MKYVAPSAEELARRGLDPDGKPLAKPKTKLKDTLTKPKSKPKE